MRPVVLCVDDEPGVLGALRRLLRREPYELVTTTDPSQALQWVDERDISLVIADQRMPEMFGTELLGRVQERSPATTRVLLTGYPGAEPLLARMTERVHRLLTKPWDNEALRRTILELLEKKEVPPEGAQGWIDDP